MLNSNRKKFSPHVKMSSREERHAVALMKKAYQEAEARRQLAKVSKHETRD